MAQPNDDKKKKPKNIGERSEAHWTVTSGRLTMTDNPDPSPAEVPVHQPSETPPLPPTEDPVITPTENPVKNPEETPPEPPTEIPEDEYDLP